MITNLSITSKFKAIPYLPPSQLFKTHKGNFVFSTEKPNVIIGPNGAGKSALMKALALHTLSYYIGKSTFDSNFLKSTESEEYWTKTGNWSNEYTYLEGFDSNSDFGPALYYRPGHIPGNDDSITAAMMCGYFEQAKAYGQLVDQKSSGQQTKALLALILDYLSGKKTELGFDYVHWGFGREPVDLNKASWNGPWDYKAEIFKKLYGQPNANAIPLILMDEPEQSLDLKAETLLWNQIGSADCSKVQIIVASHSVHPFLETDKYNIIEAVPGYLQELQQLLPR